MRRYSYVALVLAAIIFIGAKDSPWKITAYDSDVACTGKTDGITASGVVAKKGMVAHKSLPFGTIVRIDGLGVFEVQDRGRLQKHQLDVWVPSHTEAIDFGVQRRRVKIIGRNCERRKG